jgi:hypothetical protein
MFGASKLGRKKEFCIYWTLKCCTLREFCNIEYSILFKVKCFNRVDISACVTSSSVFTFCKLKLRYKKKSRRIETFLESVSQGFCSKIEQAILFRVNCFNRAYISASATIGAYFRINFIDIALSNCFNWAFIDTSTTSSTVFTNFISHCCMCLMLLTFANIFR